MNRIHVLDCTLRDGGYCNGWKFGFENIKAITSGLVSANVDVIECGFLTNKIDYDHNISKYTSIDQIANVLPADRRGKVFVAMVNYDEYCVDDIPVKKGNTIDGLRIAFHKKDWKPALRLCEQIKAKGYMVYVQAMVSLNYTDDEFLSLIRGVNCIEPDVFYIVDSFGVMKEKDLMRLFYMTENNLKKSIGIGFHSHNNMQLAYSNAQKLVNIQTNRALVIDTCIMGMGRGAGNLNTELFLDYLNDGTDNQYHIAPLLSIIDNILNGFYQKRYWGYSLPNYISAMHDAHPNYALFLDEKKTLTIEAMNEIFDMMDDGKKCSYDKDYIEDLYLKYQEKDRVQEYNLNELKNRLNGKIVLMIAPGPSSIKERDRIIECAKEKDVVSISINHDYDSDLIDYIFISNLRRYQNIPEYKRKKSIVTSNIPALGVYLQVRYTDLLNEQDGVRDNAGLMLAKLAVIFGAKKILIGGMDGYSYNSIDNYADETMDFFTEKMQAEKRNYGMEAVLKELKKQVDIEFITTPKHVVI